MNEQAIFAKAIQLESDQRREFLDDCCGTDQALRNRLDKLIGLHEKAGRFLENPAAVVDVTIDEPNSENGNESSIGPYKLLEVIGEGGMGSVYMAKQTEPVNRRVAVKLIKTGMDTRQVIARFEAERQALAMMDHPNIAKVLDAAATESGRPYFVMELVKGKPITKFCDDQRLDLKSRLKLFQQVCHAVQHAHQKGIIHRDIKPSNVLVAMYDDKPVPKVIDFGVAKATGEELTDKTMFTRFGQIVGTLEYMSPEQAQFNNLDIDTRSDIYSLGAILCELLSGEPPFDREKIKKQALDETLRMIREDEPTKPSTNLSGSARSAQVATTRKTSPEKLGSILRGDLDWIVMKALEKDRLRRYETANGLALDLERYMSDEAVLATPPSNIYRFTKFAKRNKAGLAFGSLVGVFLIAGFVGLTISNILLAKREKETVAAQRKADENFQLATAATRRENTRLAQLVKSNAILASVFEDLDIDQVKQGPDPLDVILGGRLVDAGNQLDADTVGDPLIVATIQLKLANALYALGFNSDAFAFCEKSYTTRSELLGLENPETLESMKGMIIGYARLGQYDKAISHGEKTLQLTNKTLGREHVDTGACVNALGLAYRRAGQLGKAIPLLKQSMELAEKLKGEDHPNTLQSMHNLALAYSDAGQLDKAFSLLELTLQKRHNLFGDNDHISFTILNDLALTYQRAGERDKALSLFENAFEGLKQRLGENHPRTLTTMGNLAGAYMYVGQHAKALDLRERAFMMKKAKLGDDHPDTLLAMQDLASSYWMTNQLEESVPLFEKVVVLLKSRVGRNHPNTQMAIFNLGINYKDIGQLEDALPLLEESYTSEKNDLRKWQFGAGLIDAYLEKGNTNEAEKVAGEVEYIGQGFAPDSPIRGELLATLGRLYYIPTERFTDAERVLRECLAIRKKAMPNKWQIFDTQSLLGKALLGQQQYVEAESNLLAGYHGLAERRNLIPPVARKRVKDSLQGLVILYETWHSAEPRAGYRSKAEFWQGKLQEENVVENIATPGEAKK